MIVVDTSAAIAALVGRPQIAGLVERLVSDGDLHAPHLIDVEVIHVLRKLVARGDLTYERAADARLDFDALVITRYPHQPLADRMWVLRDNLSAYDAAFVALAECLDAPLVTCDERLARGAGNDVEIELFAPEG